MILQKKKKVIYYSPKLEELALEQFLSTCNDNKITFTEDSGMVYPCTYEGVSFFVSISFDTIMNYCRKHNLGFCGYSDYFTGLDIGIVYKRVPN